LCTGGDTQDSKNKTTSHARFFRSTFYQLRRRPLMEILHFHFDHKKHFTGRSTQKTSQKLFLAGAANKS
jgi:hypothetical protein